VNNTLFLLFISEACIGMISIRVKIVRRELQVHAIKINCILTHHLFLKDTNIRFTQSVFILLIEQHTEAVARSSYKSGGCILTDDHSLSVALRPCWREESNIT
jgi:hypothetical protein